MIMKREAIADRGIWTAKKRYILNVHDSEGVRYSEPKLKIMGIEAVRSSTPGSCRSKIKEALKIIMKDNETTLIQFIEKFKKEFFDMPVEDIAFPRSVNNLLEYSNSLTIYRKGTPIHVRGSLLFNHLLEKNKLTQKYTKINEGEKIKFVYLKMPNPIRENVIAFSNILPEEFGLHEYIDYSMQFEKTFTDPLSKILDVINWNYERRSNLDLFFSE
jgi:DNA polymerase elongation subunit (family B)